MAGADVRASLRLAPSQKIAGKELASESCGVRKNGTSRWGLLEGFIRSLTEPLRGFACQCSHTGALAVLWIQLSRRNTKAQGDCSGARALLRFCRARRLGEQCAGVGSSVFWFWFWLYGGSDAHLLCASSQANTAASRQQLLSNLYLPYLSTSCTSKSRFLWLGFVAWVVYLRIKQVVARHTATSYRRGRGVKVCYIT